MIQKYNRVKTNEGKTIWEKEFKKNKSTCDMMSNQEIMGFWRQTDMNRDRCWKAKSLWFIYDAVEKLDQTNRKINDCLL